MAEATSDSARVPPYSGMFSAIVPCRDEREALPIFYAEFMRAMDSACAENFEIIFVEDGSKDGTLEYLRELAAKDSRVKYISLSRNFGKEAAMYAGLRAARGDIAAIMDADLQDPPSLLPQMFMEMRVGGYDSLFIFSIEPFIPKDPSVNISSAPYAFIRVLLSTLIVSGITIITLYPFKLPIIDKAIPVFPLVASTNTSPFFNSPFFSRFSTI